MIDSKVALGVWIKLNPCPEYDQPNAQRLDLFLVEGGRQGLSHSLIKAVLTGLLGGPALASRAVPVIAAALLAG